jgi:phosphatidylinositol glycan class K
MLADDMACNARNPRPATVFNNANQHINVYGDDIEVDYRGYEVTVENFLRVLTGRLDSSVPRSKRLLTDDRSNVLIYMTGHGGDGFLKFQDAEEISSAELADAFEQMWQKRRYNELMFTIETCQAASMIHKFYSPNIVASGSSRVGEDALSHHMDSAIGVHIIDRWTYYALEFLEKVTPASKATLRDFFGYFDPEKVKSHPELRTDLFERDLNKVLVTDFFGSVRNTEMLNKTEQGETESFLQRLHGLQNDCSIEDTDNCISSPHQPSDISLPSAHILQPSDHLNVPLSDEARFSLTASESSLTHQVLGVVLLAAMTTAAGMGLCTLFNAHHSVN